jgi:uncharacterized protein (DUF302 family)
MLLIGFVVGVISSSLLFVYIMRKYMLIQYKINGGFEEVEEAVKKVIPEFQGWSFPIPDWQFYKSQASKGFKYDNIKNMIMYFVCKPAYANRVLRIDPKLGGIMPCTWAIYETKNGEVYIAKMNIALMSKMYFGVVGEVMKEVAETEEKMLFKIRDLIKKKE